MSTVERMRGEGVVVDCQEGGKEKEGRGGKGEIFAVVGIIGVRKGGVVLVR